MRSIDKLVTDFWSLRRVCGWAVAMRWLSSVAVTAGSVLREGNLQAADRRMGDGPFRCVAGNGRALLSGPDVMSGIREIWCRRVYESPDVCLPSDGLVVDLGANMGNFTMLALAMGDRVRIVSVEANKNFVPLLQKQLAMNGWSDRCTIVNAIIGTSSPGLDATLATRPDAFGRRLTQEQLLEFLGPERIAFLKCDIEGSEFGLLTRGSRLLERTDRLAMEVHDQAGDRRQLIAVLQGEGFDVTVARVNPMDAIVLGHRREMNSRPLDI